MTHSELVRIAHKWLVQSHHGVVLSEIASSSRVIPDAIGWKSFHTTMIECKVSRADFHADKNKPFHLGSIRYYMAPEGVLTVADIPEAWGFLELVDGRVRVRQKPEGIDRRTAEELREEMCIVVSALRRMKQRDFLTVLPDLSPEANSPCDADGVAASRNTKELKSGRAGSGE